MRACVRACLYSFGYTQVYVCKYNMYISIVCIAIYTAMCVSIHRAVFQAALKASKLGLALNLLRQRSSYGDFHHVDENKCNMFHLLAAHADKDISAPGQVMQVHVLSFLQISCDVMFKFIDLWTSKYIFLLFCQLLGLFALF